MKQSSHAELRNMSALRNTLFGCVSDRSLVIRPNKVKFGVPLTEAFKGGTISSTIIEMFAYLARDGVKTRDIFRRPGKTGDIKILVKKLSEGRSILVQEYSYYTIASLIKKFLMRLPQGLFGRENEERLLGVSECDNCVEQLEVIHTIISSLPEVSQHFLALLFGTWFRIIKHSSDNQMSSKALAKSVTGSLFHTCQESPQRIHKASAVLEVMIKSFGDVNLFGRSNIEYFAETTRTRLSFKEKLQSSVKYPSDKIISHHTEVEFAGADSARERFPSESQRSDAAKEILSHKNSLSAPEVRKKFISVEERLAELEARRQCQSTSRFQLVRQRQLERLRRRTQWFNDYNNTPSQTSCCSKERSPSVGLASDSDSLFSEDFLGATSTGGSFLSAPAVPDAWERSRRQYWMHHSNELQARVETMNSAHFILDERLEEESNEADVFTRQSSRKSRTSNSSRKSASAPGPSGYPDLQQAAELDLAACLYVNPSRSELDEGISSCEDTLDHPRHSIDEHNSIHMKADLDQRLIAGTRSEGNDHFDNSSNSPDDSAHDCHP